MKTTYKPDEQEELLENQNQSEETQTTGEASTQIATEVKTSTRNTKRDIYFDVAGGYL